MCYWYGHTTLHLQCAALSCHSGSCDRATIPAHMTITRPTTSATEEGIVVDRRQRWLLLMLGAAIFMINLDSRVIAPLLPTMATAFHTSVSSVGILITAYMLPYGLF